MAVVRTRHQKLTHGHCPELWTQWGATARLLWWAPQQITVGSFDICAACYELGYICLLGEASRVDFCWMLQAPGWMFAVYLLLAVSSTPACCMLNKQNQKYGYCRSSSRQNHPLTR